jgi:hypothetical protein
MNVQLDCGTGDCSFPGDCRDRQSPLEWTDDDTVIQLSERGTSRDDLPQPGRRSAQDPVSRAFNPAGTWPGAQ